MELQKLSLKARKYWLTINIIWSAIISIASVLIILLAQGVARKVLALALGIPAFLVIALLIVYPFLKYHFYSYGYNDKKIIIKRGVIFRHTITIPVCQLQDLHIFEGPIMMAFKLSSVDFSTAGSNFSVVCLESSVANKIVSELEVYLKNRLEEKENEKI